MLVSDQPRDRSLEWEAIESSTVFSVWRPLWTLKAINVKRQASWKLPLPPRYTLAIKTKKSPVLFVKDALSPQRFRIYLFMFGFTLCGSSHTEINTMKVWKEKKMFSLAINMLLLYLCQTEKATYRIWIFSNSWNILDYFTSRGGKPFIPGKSHLEIYNNILEPYKSISLKIRLLDVVRQLINSSQCLPRVRPNYFMGLIQPEGRTFPTPGLNHWVLSIS